MRRPCPQARREIARRVLAAVTVALAVCGGVEALVRWGGLVDVDRFVRPSPAVRVLDREGALLRVYRAEGGDQRWVSLRDVSPVLISAVLAAEDGRFFGHRGVDGWALARALVSNLVPGRRLSGASTITQQLVKRVYGRPHGVWDKGVEALRAMALERVVSKDEILEQYLNRLPYGDGLVGVARACEAYLGHGPEVMTPAEAALIAGIPQAPAHTEPRRHLRRALARRGHILAAMHAHGWITREALRSARSERPAIVSEAPHPVVAMRFTDEALRRLRVGELAASGGALRTSLHRGLQLEAESLLEAGVARLAPRGAVNGAAMVVRHDTGEVFVYVGAARPQAEGGAMDLLRRPRQPGSTLKPFVFERFFEGGGSPATVLSDVGGRWTGRAGKQYDARDYDGRERGPVRARVALASSLNLAALDAAGRVGQEPLVARLRALGFSRAEDASALGAAVVLGGLDVTAVELMGAYVALARGGERVPLSFAPGATPDARRVMRADAVAMTTDVLSDALARVDGFGRSLEALAPGAPFALKTGTSSGWRDAWCVVYDGRWAVLVWLGHPGGDPMAGVSGFEGAAPLAVQLLGAARRLPGRDAPREPVALREVEVCAHSGLRAGPLCARTVRERLPAGRELPPRCDAHTPDGRDLVAPRFAAWARRRHLAGAAPRAGRGALQVVSPERGARLLASDLGGRIRLVALVEGGEPEGLRWRVDGRESGDSWTMVPGRHTVEVIAADGRRAVSDFTVEVPR
ncbi:MAG: transglycosylase domain-containing protein [Polyangiales bacterium]